MWFLLLLLTEEFLPSPIGPHVGRPAQAMPCAMSLAIPGDIAAVLLAPACRAIRLFSILFHLAYLCLEDPNRRKTGEKSDFFWLKNTVPFGTVWQRV